MRNDIEHGRPFRPNEQAALVRDFLRQHPQYQPYIRAQDDSPAGWMFYFAPTSGTGSGRSFMPYVMGD